MKLLWECTVRTYKVMCGISSWLDEHRLGTKYNEAHATPIVVVLGIQERWEKVMKIYSLTLLTCHSHSLCIICFHIFR